MAFRHSMAEAASTQSPYFFSKHLAGQVLRGVIAMPTGEMAFVFENGRVLVAVKSRMLSELDSRSLLEEMRQRLAMSAVSLNALEPIVTPDVAERLTERRDVMQKARDRGEVADLDVPDFMRGTQTVREELGVSVDDEESAYRTAVAASAAIEV